MIIRGIKASHDGAVAVVEDGRLGFSVANERTQFGMTARDSRHERVLVARALGEILE